MARNIGMDNNETFRSVHVLRYHGQEKTFTYYEGPYSKKGPARARVSYWRNRYGGRRYSTEFVDGWIERSVSHWERVE